MGAHRTPPWLTAPMGSVLCALAARRKRLTQVLRPWW